MSADGSNLRQLTDAPFDDFSPRYLPNGKILFVSTRRGGFHRCGRGPCPVFTLATANGDGSDPRVISFHETHEWDPAVLNDGRVIYTRWDYVDRHAVHYQQLWSVRPDGSDVRIFYGKQHLKSGGRLGSSPGAGFQLRHGHSRRAPRHDGRFDNPAGRDQGRRRARADHPPHARRPLPPRVKPGSSAGTPRRASLPRRRKRWKKSAGQTTPIAHPSRFPKTYFLASYSYIPLLGEPFANVPNMFGIYLVDRFGNKELLYRDISISSLWPTPLRPRRPLPDLPSALVHTEANEGTFFVQNVHQSWPNLDRKGQSGDQGPAADPGFCPRPRPTPTRPR